MAIARPAQRPKQGRRLCHAPVFTATVTVLSPPTKPYLFQLFSLVIQLPAQLGRHIAMGVPRLIIGLLQFTA